jgi:hypothetical protein
MGDQADVADPTALRGKQDMIAGVAGVLTVTQDQQHPAATCRRRQRLADQQDRDCVDRRGQHAHAPRAVAVTVMPAPPPSPAAPPAVVAVASSATASRSLAVAGEQMGQAEMMRHLNEMIWFPAAFLDANISFEAVDGSSARVSLTDHGRTVTATMFFDQQGRPTDFVAQRYRAADSSDPDTWSTPFTGYGEFEGLRLPSHGKAIYKFPGRYFL